MASHGLTHAGVTADGRPCAVMYIEPGAILDTGLWCPGCNLPAAVKVEVLAVTDDGFTPVGTGVVWCDDCRHLCQSARGCDPK